MSIRCLVLAAVAALTWSCGAAGPSPDLKGAEPRHLDTGVSWTEFLSRTYREPESGIFIVDGDIPIPSVKRLREFYERHVRPGQLIIHHPDGLDARWGEADRLNLTYCVSSTFGSRHAAVVEALAEATAAWEEAADVDFIHLPTEDATCTSSNGDVLFDVRPVITNAYLARAFFPGEARPYRNVLIDADALVPGVTPGLDAILRHELGHVLGFRHEHTRPEAGTCFEDDNWRELTSYDPASVMHYPQCHGTAGWALVLTPLDKQGAASVYGAPGEDDEGNAGGSAGPSPRTTTVSGTVAMGELDHHGPFAVVPGTSFDVAMSGLGDPDLYVRFGAPPGTSSFHCRPYVYGARETCKLAVPAGVTTAYVGVRGYASGAYTLDIAWTEPAEQEGGDTGGSTGTAKSASFSGSVGLGESRHHGPLEVKAGTAFKVVMTGYGDPDLYVRWNEQPTTSQFHCRPYLDGPNEVCTLEVPAGATRAYLMVRGFRAGAYSLEVDYVN